MIKASPFPFASRVAEGMSRRGFTLRSFCRAVSLDPSFFSKVLSGKRSPPSEEAVLRRIAAALGLDAAELIVAAGRIPSEWKALWRDPELFRDIHSLATQAVLGARPPGGRASRRPPAAKPGRIEAVLLPVRPDLAEELL